jgi:hypothetical protein
VSAYVRTYEARTLKEAAGKRALAEGEHSPFLERPVGGRGGGGGGAGGGREEEEDVLRELRCFNGEADALDAQL